MAVVKSKAGRSMFVTKKRRIKPDAIDRKILGLLHRDGRISKIDMSRRVALSATRCWERMRRMEKEGIIRGYHADIDLGRVAGLSYFIVQLRLISTSSDFVRAARFERAVANVDAIISCHAVLGTVDYVLVAAARSIENFNAIMEKLATQDGVQLEFVTHAVSKVVKTPASVRLGTLIEEGQIA
jgi:Lrp/AsnC family transcriptional regulator of ectoine degradation